jgi:hypothetical protein
MKGGKPMQIADEQMRPLPFRAFRKIALLRARLLTNEDYAQRGGIIRTREGPAGFRPGDYLARGIQDEEWPITREHFETGYEQVTEPDAQGFATYRARAICQAYQMSEPFTVRRTRGDVLAGKAGDYLVRSGDRTWIVDGTIFEQSYERVAE